MEEPETVCECVEDGTFCQGYDCGLNPARDIATFQREAGTCPGMNCPPIFLHCTCT